MLTKAALKITSIVMFSASSFALSAQEAPMEEQPVTLDQLIEAWVVQEGIEIIISNIEASKNESGELDKLVRASIGVSIGDIKEYGLRGGPNSEVSKILRALGAID